MRVLIDRARAGRRTDRARAGPGAGLHARWCRRRELLRGYWISNLPLNRTGFAVAVIMSTSHSHSCALSVERRRLLRLLLVVSAAGVGVVGVARDGWTGDVLAGSSPGAELFAFGPGAGIDPAEVGRLRGLTTLALFHWPPRDGLLEAAHAHGIRVVHAISCAWPANGTAGCGSLPDPAARAGFVRSLAALQPAADGVSVDIEGYSGPPSDLTSFVRELRAGLRAVVGGAPAQVSVCVGAWPINPHYKRIHYGDGYDYASLVAPGAADFLFVMAYDMA